MKETTKPECRHFIGTEDRYCRSGEGVRRYVPGPRCPAHTPSALQGKAEPEPGPGIPAWKGEGQ